MLLIIVHAAVSFAMKNVVLDKFGVAYNGDMNGCTYLAPLICGWSSCRQRVAMCAKQAQSTQASVYPISKFSGTGSIYVLCNCRLFL